MTAAQPTLQIDNDRVRVTEWRFAPGTETGWHTHEMDYVVVPLYDGTLRIETDRWSHRSRAAPRRVVCTSSRRGAQRHQHDAFRVRFRRDRTEGRFVVRSALTASDCGDLIAAMRRPGIVTGSAPVILITFPDYDTDASAARRCVDCARIRDASSLQSAGRGRKKSCLHCPPMSPGQSSAPIHSLARSFATVLAYG